MGSWVLESPWKVSMGHVCIINYCKWARGNPMAFHILINKLISSGCSPLWDQVLAGLMAEMTATSCWVRQSWKRIWLRQCYVKQEILVRPAPAGKKKYCLLVIPKSYCHCLIGYPSYNLSRLFSKLQYYSLMRKRGNSSPLPKELLTAASLCVNLI